MLQTLVPFSVCVAEHKEDFQSVWPVLLHALEPPGGLQIAVTLAQLPCVQRSSWDAFKLWCLQGSREAGCSVALCAADLLGCLRLWCQLPDCSECRESSGMAQDMVPTALSAEDCLEWVRI